MFLKIIPRSIKSRIREFLRNVAKQPPYYPSHGDQFSYFISNDSKFQVNGIVVPPPALWMGYGGTPAEYLESGKRDVDAMARIIKKNEFDIASAKRILDFGCAAGRMIRHLPAIAPNVEFWGTDIGADQIQWCRDNLTPPINFAVTTTLPHLPFCDGFFDLIYCGSVFTHIEDIEQAWLLELGRILRPGGCLYLTIHDQHTISRLDGDLRDCWLAKIVAQYDVYVRNKKAFNIIVVGRGEGSQVFYRDGYFKTLVPPIFDWLDHVPNAYSYQSAVILRRKDV